MRGSTAFRAAVAPGGVLAGPWVKNELWRRAKAVPSLDLRFADNKSLVDATTGAQLVTFTRASSGTFVGSDGVIRTATTNLLPRSEEFGTTWTPTNATISANAITAPNGTSTADKLVETVDNGVHAVTQGTVTSGLAYVFSVYAKAGERTRMQLSGMGAEGQGFFTDYNLSTGIVSSAPSGSQMIAVGDGWYRCTLVITASATGGPIIRIRDSSGNNSYTGDGTSGLFLWGAQLEQSSSVGEYIPTTSTINSAPRFDHNPTTGESLGLLVEEQRTNSIRNNTMVGAVAGTPGTPPTNWTGNVTTSGVSREIIGTGTENGISYIDYKISGTTTGTLFFGIRPELGLQVVAANGQTWTFSSYIKLVGGTLANLAIKYGMSGNDSNGTAITFPSNSGAIPTNAPLITQRIANTITFANASVAFVQPYIQVEAASGVVIDVTLRIGLPQLEQGAFATSVIPTTTAAVTRSADVASITGSAFSSWYRQDEGTVFIEGVMAPSLSRFAPELALSDGTDTNKIEFYNYPSGYGCTVRASGQTNTDPILILSPTSGLPYRKAIALKANDYRVAAQGQQGTSANPSFIPTVNELKVGTSRGGATSIGSTIRRLVFWPRRLGNEALQEVTR